MKLSELKWESGKRPLQTVPGLEKLRNAIAHGKPEKHAGKVTHPKDTASPYPAFSLRSMFTPNEKMPKAVRDVEQLANEIQKAAKPKLNFSDVWFGKRGLPTGHRVIAPATQS